MSDNTELLADFLEDAVITHKSSFVAVAKLPDDAKVFDRDKHLLLPKPSPLYTAANFHDPNSAIRLRHQARHGGNYQGNIADLTIDMTGNTVAHVMSITKAIMGLFWAYCIHNIDGHFPELRTKLLDKTSEQSKLGFYLSPCHINIPKIRDAYVVQALTQSTGIVIADTNAFSMLRTLIMSSRHEAEGYELTSIDSELSENLFGTPTQHNEFHYSDKMTQVTSMALEDMFKKLYGDDYLLAEQIPRIFFPESLQQAQNIKEWPLISAGYTTTYTKTTASSSSTRIKQVTVPVLNSLGFWGVRMSGQQMLDYGAFILLHFRPLLLKIYDDNRLYLSFPPITDPQVKDEARKLGGDIHKTRGGWRYSCFWWIPRFEDYPVANSKYKWISAIGHEGQFILLELTQRWLFVRQHFKDNPSFENVDLEHVTPSGSDQVRYPSFCYDAFILVCKLNGDKLS